MFAPKVHGELQWFERRTPGVRAWLHPRVGPELSSAWLQSVPTIATPNSNASGDRASGWSADGAWFLKIRRGRSRKLLRALARGLELEDCGLPIPVHLGVLFAQGHTTLITEALAGFDASLELEAPEAFSAAPNAESTGLPHAQNSADLDRVLPALAEEARAALCAQLGALVAELHTSGFRQRDLKAPNLLVTPDGALVLLDLEGVRRSRSPRHFQKYLARLAASLLAMLPQGQAHAALAQVLDAYREQAPSGMPDDLLERVLARAHRKLARNQRQKRPLR